MTLSRQLCTILYVLLYFTIYVCRKRICLKTLQRDLFLLFQLYSRIHGYILGDTIGEYDQADRNALWWTVLRTDSTSSTSLSLSGNRAQFLHRQEYHIAECFQRYLQIHQCLWVLLSISRVSVAVITTVLKIRLKIRIGGILTVHIEIMSVIN